MRRATLFLLSTVGLPALSGCQKKAKHYETHVEVIQVRQFGQTNRLTDLEVKYVDCPGNLRKIMRADKEFAACGAKLKPGDRLDAEVEFGYNGDRDQYTSRWDPLESTCRHASLSIL